MLLDELNSATTTEIETVNENSVNEQHAGNETQDSQNIGNDNAEIVKLRSELAKQKAATDKATKEAGDYRKALRAKQSAEEIAAEEKKAADEATKKEIEELRREVARAKSVKTVMGKLGTGEEESAKIADYLYGAEDVDAALTEIQRAWATKEKALRMEFGKIPLPGAGAENTAVNEAINRARELGKAKAETNKQASEALKAYMR